MRDLIRKNKILFYPIKFIYRLLNFGLGVIVALFALIEVPIFLMTHPRIFRNEIVYVFWHWSFGHTVAGIDYASRLYYPNRISLIYIPHPTSNKYLPFCFGHNAVPFIYKGLIPPLNGLLGAPRYYYMRFVLILISAITNRFQVIEHSNIYKTLSLADGKLMAGDEEKGFLEKYNDWSGYIRLLRDDIGKKPCLPNNLDEECRNGIKQQYPNFFNKSFVVILLRNKGLDGNFSTSSRCVGKQENYRDAVKFLTSNGYFVVGTGETEHEKFRDIDGYYSFNDVNVPKSLMSLFLLMNCKLFIGQQSGPHVLPDSCGILCLLCDAMPYRLGTFRKDDIILFKHLKERKTGKMLSVVDVFKNHQDLAYGYNFAKKNIEILPNTSEEILEAVKECHVTISGELRLSEEDLKLCDRFQRLPAEGMTICYQGNRIPLYMLRKLKSQLLNWVK